MTMHVRNPIGHRVTSSATRPFTSLRTRMRANATVYRVELEHSGKVHNLDVPAGQTILEVATEKYKLDLPHDCKLGVCMTCPAKLVSGQVDQSGSMLSEDVAGKGYALLCVAQPLSDCKILTITEDELLDQQLGA